MELLERLDNLGPNCVPSYLLQLKASTPEPEVFKTRRCCCGDDREEMVGSNCVILRKK